VSTAIQTVVESLNGKNAKGAIVVGGCIAVAGNGLLAATTAGGTIALTAISNLYFSLPTFRESSKKVSEAVRKSIGHGSPRAFSIRIGCYRYGVPLLLIGGIGGVALAGYSVATIAASQMTASGESSALGMSSALSTGIGWASSVMIPMGTAVTSLWWNKKGSEKVRELLRSDPAYIDNIDVNFSDLETVEKFGHEAEFKKFLLQATVLKMDIGQSIRIVRRAADKAQQDLVTATTKLDREQSQIKVLNNENNQLQTEITVQQNEIKKIEESMERLRRLAKESKELEEKRLLVNDKLQAIHISDEKIRVQMALADCGTELEEARNELEAAQEERAILIAMKHRDKVRGEFQILVRIQKILNSGIEHERLKDEIKRTLGIGEIEMAESALAKKKSDLDNRRSEVEQRLLVIAREITTNKANLLNLRTEVAKKQAVRHRVNRAIRALESQISSEDELKELRDQLSDVVANIFIDPSSQQALPALPQALPDLLDQQNSLRWG
jgi:hypothetical protein